MGNDNLEIMTVEECEECRRNSIRDWDGFKYKQIYDRLGLEPDVPELYAKGTAEEIYFDNLASEYLESGENKKHSKSGERYILFYENWRISTIDEKNFESDSDEKRKALLIFPKFSKKGAQPIDNYSDMKIGSLYKKMLEEAKKRICNKPILQ